MGITTYLPTYLSTYHGEGSRGNPAFQSKPSHHALGRLFSFQKCSYHFSVTRGVTLHLFGGARVPPMLSWAPNGPPMVRWAPPIFGHEPPTVLLDIAFFTYKRTNVRTKIHTSHSVNTYWVYACFYQRWAPLPTF